MLFLRQKQRLFKLVEFPSKVLFKPNKHYVAELEKKDYLGKAKVRLYLILAVGQNISATCEKIYWSCDFFLRILTSKSELEYFHN